MHNIYCSFCEHEFNRDEVALSVLTKGIIVLTGREKTAMGLSCLNPACQETLFMIVPSKDFLPQFEEFLRDPPSLTYPTHSENGSSIADSFVYPKYKYYLPWLYFDDDADIFSSFDIRKEFFGNTVGERDILRSSLNDDLDGPDFENFMCSYVPDWDWIPASRPQSFALWFREDQLMDLLKLENEYGEKIFPRYLHMNKQQLAIEQLSASQSYDYLKAGKIWDVPQEDLADQEHKIQPPEGIIIGTISYAGPTKIPYTEIDAQRFINVLGSAGNSTFLEILTSDPGLFDISMSAPFSTLLYRFSKVKNPFLGEAKHFDLLNVDLEIINQTEKDKEHFARIQKIREKATSPYVQDWLSQNIDSFIADYERIQANIDYCYADLWTLIRREAARLYKHLDKKTRKEKHAFYLKGEMYYFVFDGGDEVPMQDQAGLRCLHHLIKNKQINISVKEFEIIYRSFGEFIELKDVDDKKLKLHEDFFGPSQEIIDDQGIMDLNEKIQRLKNQLEHENLIRDERPKILRQIKTLEKEFKKITYGGKSKTFSTELNNLIKKHKGNINYSLTKLAKIKGGKKIAKHFHFSLYGLDTPHFRYYPHPDIDWYL